MIIIGETPLSLRHSYNLFAPYKSLVVPVQMEEGWCKTGPLLLQQDEDLLSQTRLYFNLMPTDDVMLFSPTYQAPRNVLNQETFLVKWSRCNLKKSR